MPTTLSKPHPVAIDKDEPSRPDLAPAAWGEFWDGHRGLVRFVGRGWGGQHPTVQDAKALKQDAIVIRPEEKKVA